jgi:hypothetical protein
MAKLATVADRRVFSNLAYVRVTPWSTETSGPDKDIYDITEVVADTTSVEQADNDVNTIEHEFSNNPLFENIQLGDKTFTCESIDLQDAVLKDLFGWQPIGSDGVAAPNAYKHLYATIELGFDNTDDEIVLPKVLLNSRAVIASMKTDASRATISGTCYNAFVDDVETDMAILKGAKTEVETEISAILARVKAEKTA